MNLCPHVFEDVPAKEGWDFQFVIKTQQPSYIRNMVTTSGIYHDVALKEADCGFIGMSIDYNEVLDFLEWVKEENPKFKYESEVLVPQLSVNLDCPKCNGVLVQIDETFVATEKPVGYKGMTSENASAVKKEGHEKEEYFASLIGGECISGHTKPDVRSFSHKLRVSCKKKGKRYQVYLLSGNTLKKTNSFGGVIEGMQACLDVYDNEATREQQKYALNAPMIRLAQILQDKNELENFLNSSFFDGFNVNEEHTANAIALEDEAGVWYVYEQYEFLNIITQNISITNSDGEYGPQKVIFKATIGRKDCSVTIGEIEVRYDELHKNELKFFFNGPEEKRSLFHLLRKKIIEEERLSSRIVLCGTAVKFKEDIII